MADNMPDFDNMSPEELMRWMESLAKRQGVSDEELLTGADMQVAEIDPDTVILDEPGYVPSEGKSKGQAVLPPAKARQPAAPAPADRPTPPPAPAPATPPPPAVQQPAASLEPLDLGQEEAETEVSEPVGTQDAMAWLESLAADQSGLPEFDLSGLGAEIEPVAVEPAAKTDPIKWLEGLTESQGEAAPIAREASDPFAGGVDPMNWLESLAKRQGVKNEELLTRADLNVPEPDTIADSGPGYTEYSVDAPLGEQATEPGSPSSRIPEPAAIDPSQLESPADWLDSLASGQGFTTKPAEAQEPLLSDDEMKEALRSGKEIAPEEMEAWFNRQLDRGFEREEPDPDEALEAAEPEYDPEAPAIPAALPDWLSEMAPAPPEPPRLETTEQQAFIDQIVEPPAVPDMPDWLKEEVSAHSDLDLDNIFASTEATAVPTTPEPVVSQPAAQPIGELEVDHTDPWVEAFDHEQGIITLPDLPAAAAPAPLEEAVLEPEAELPAGQPETVPDWLSEAAPAEPVEAEMIELGEMPDWLSEAAPKAAAEPISTEDMPDWLKEVGAEVELHEIPDWLKETGDTEEQAAIAQPPPAPAVTTPVVIPAVSPAPAASMAISPAPVPVAATLGAGEAASVLTNARGLAQNDVDASLLEYEKLVRANVELGAVVGDLTQLVSRHDKHPGVYRVLGDGLMRQGQLQAALDTYRKALNLL